MFPHNPSIVARYAFTILAVTLATLLRFALIPVLGLRVPFILYFPTIVVCAWFGGLWQGLLSTVIGGLIALFAFREPQFTFKLSDQTILAQLVVFLLAGALISLLAESLHRARRRTEESEARERQQRERFRITLASIGDAVIATDTDGQVTFMNQIAESLTGWKDAGAAGRPLAEVFNIINEQSRQPVENPALRAIKEGVIFGLANHTLLIAKDGTERPIDDSGAPIKDANGKTLGAVLIFRDITDRRRAEKERALLAEIVGSSEDAIISKNLDGRIESWNAAAERLFEYTANEALGRPITLIIPPERLEEERLILERLRRGERIEHFETVRCARSGRAVDISLTVSPVRDSEGRIIGASKIARDITERKRAEAALHQQREWLRVTLSSIGDAVIATDTNGNITFLNHVAESLTGWRREEAEGRPLQEVFNIVNEETRETVENPAMRAIREGIVVGLANHTALIARDGTERPIDDSGAPIKDSDGKILGAVLIFRDVTDRRSDEDRFRLAVESSPAAKVMIDEEGRIMLVNSQTERLFGYPRGELLGQPIEMLVPERFRGQHPEHRAGFAAAPQVRPMGVGRDLFGLRKDGSEVPVEIGLNPLKVKGKTMVLSSIVDITERKRAEEERARLLASERAAREQAEAANRSKDEFVAMISHEIRSPLNAILGWAQMLRMGKFDSEETARVIETIERNARAQSQLIEDLLDISRVITGKLTLNVRAVEPAQFVEAALDTIRPAADAKSIQLHTRLAPRGGVVSGDPARLQQVVWNLLSNAVKFTPRHGRVEVRLERINSHLEIKVSDSGEGINPEFLPFVFDRFSQANTSSERKHGGLGLGLAIVRHLVELHGGTVRAESRGEGQGATFTVKLPVRGVREERSELERAGAKHTGSPADAVRLDGLRVMIVDDEAETRELLTAMLTRRGAEIKACASAAEVLEAVEAWRPSILVSDIGMPNEDGYALIRRLRAMEPERGGNIPAVALTGFARSEDRLRTLAAGFQMHVSKPVEAVELIMVIASLTGRLG